VVALAGALALVLVACGGGGDDGGVAGPGTVAPLPKVTVAGDSIAYALGAALRTPLGEGVDVVVIAEGSTGLARPDTFDWPMRLERLAREFPPAVLVLSVGSNDHQDLVDAAGRPEVPYQDVPSWEAAYRERLAASVDPFATTGTRVVLVGQLRTDDGIIGEANRRIHALAVEVAAERDFVEVVDLGELTGEGDEVAVRCISEDGIHLTEACTTDAAEALAPRLPL
jgi:hypothetical protein